ncbi:extensin-like domain-containing protein [Leisingera sp. McT4-56]|uniref:extensin-like domain-containing protein n=1 Tax=Leisingera sp. McT4-56 TaxID=2881255 RepID=UPI001CF828D4|nr:extensin family protein [Leisingera sp. McT4-56]MCB4455755.1 extensin family protein [Leisingera sp. McT4-56]
MIRPGALLLAAVISGAALAATPDASLEPPVRPAAETGLETGLAPVPGMRPASRPQSEQRLAAAARPANLPLLAPGASLMPSARPDSLAEQVLFKRRKLREGSVCGDIEIQGDSVGHVSGTLPGCGAKDAVRVREIAGVRLSQSSLMTCNTARALKTWINREVETAFGRRNKVVGLRVAAHYACRTRNNRPGAKISEHGKARAIDISGFTLASGETVSVLHGWQNRKTRKKLKKIWRAACGPFGTVLGPEADRYHKDHIHLDVARHRGGTYCR